MNETEHQYTPSWQVEVEEPECSKRQFISVYPGKVLLSLLPQKKAEVSFSDSVVPKSKQAIYAAGHDAHVVGLQKQPPGGLDMQDRHWWLAGWNDRDIQVRGPSIGPKGRNDPA